MINTLLGIKKNMTSTYDSRGRRVGATILEIAPNFITQVKGKDTKDGYNAVQIGIGTKKSLRKPQTGQLKKLGIEHKLRFMKETRTEEKEDLKPGTEITLNQVFSIGDAVKVTAISKGKGFQGGMKRHGFHGGPRTHGQSDRMRAPGAISSGTTPGRVRKGKKMAGHMGNVQVSAKNLEIVGLKKKENIILLKGAVPGSVGSLVTITKLGRIKGYTPPPEEKPSEEEENQTEENKTSESVNPVTENQQEVETVSSEADKENAIEEVTVSEPDSGKEQNA